MNGRYARNAGVFSQAGTERIRRATVAVAGLGGLGGHVAEALARYGVRKLLLIDDGIFDESNLNRQRFCTTRTVGQPKATATQEALRHINPDVETVVLQERLQADTAGGLLCGATAVTDCLDSIASRLTLENACKKGKLPLVHGAVAGLVGQVATILPGDDTLHKLYRTQRQPKAPPSVPAFAAQAVAALVAAEVCKLLAGEGELLRPALLLFDLTDMQFQKIVL